MRARLKTALRISKNVSALMVGRIATMALSFVFVIVLARMLGVEGFGKYAVAQRYFDLLLSLSATALSILIIREIAKQPKLLHHYVTTAVVVVLGLALIAGGLLCTLVLYIDYAPDTRIAIYLVAVALLPATVAQILESVFVAYERAEYVTFGIAIESLLRTGLGLLVLVLGYGLGALYLVLVVSRLAMMIFYTIALTRNYGRLEWVFEWRFFKQLLLDWRTFALENWLSTIYNSLGIIALSIVHGETAAGIYDAAGRILRLSRIIASSYTNAMFPYLSRLVAEGADLLRKLSAGSLKYMLTFILPVSVTLTIFADRIILLLYTEEYVASIPVLRVLAWMLLLDFVNPFLSHILFARGEQHRSLQVAAIKLSFYALLSLWLIPRWAALGVAWAGLSAGIVSFGVYFAFVMHGQGIARTLLLISRPIPAALLLGVFFFFWRESELTALLLMGGILYLLALFIFRVIPMEQLLLLQRRREETT